MCKRYQKKELLELLNFPKEWYEYDFYPDEVFVLQRKAIMSEYDGQQPLATEHFRYAAFSWWIKNYNDLNQLSILQELARFDPDLPMGKALIEEIELICKKFSS